MADCGSARAPRVTPVRKWLGGEVYREGVVVAHRARGGGGGHGAQQGMMARFDASLDRRVCDHRQTDVGDSTGSTGVIVVGE